MSFADKLSVTSRRDVLGDQDGFSRPKFLHLPANLITTNVKFERGKKETGEEEATQKAEA